MTTLTKDILFEIGLEEVPARVMPTMLEELKKLAEEKLNANHLSYEKIEVFGTPRRGVLYIQNVPTRQKSIEIERKGPSIEKAFDENKEPTKALIGFSKKAQVQVEDLVQKDGYFYAIIKEEGKNTLDILSDLLPDLLSSLHFPNHMRWGDVDYKFIRPIRFMVALFGEDIIPFSVAGVETGKISRGHRILGKKEVEITSPSLYVEKMRENFVIVKGDERKKLIKESILKIAKEHHGDALIDEDLLAEVTYLVEYPTPVLGSFEERYLRLPDACIITPMKDHQRYFPVRDAHAHLLPFFITIRDGNSDFLTTVQKGNERVLRARLADAQFFFQEDQKTTLVAKRDKLKKVVFHEHLGSMFDKSERLVKIVEKTAPFFTSVQKEIENAKRAAYLAKNDLVTAMVVEFTELEGVMGKEYALLDGEEKEVALAIEEAYLPRFVGDKNPETTLGKVMSLADKLDTLTAMFSEGLIPSGSADPFALRRKAIGIIHLLLEAKIEINLLDISTFILELLGVSTEKRENIKDELQKFILLRLKNILLEKDIRYDAIDAVFSSVTKDELDIYKIYAKIIALSAWLKESENVAKESVEAFCRVLNLSSKEKKTKDAIKRELLQEQAEEKLYAVMQSVEKNLKEKITQDDYLGALKNLQELRDPIGEFFDKVMVMDKDEKIRHNRLALLKSIECNLMQISDFRKIVF